MRQATLIAFYGAKEPPLLHLITECQRKLKEILGEQFHPYHSQQVHATLVGLQRLSGTPSYNANFAGIRHQLLPMNFGGMLNLIRTGGYLPFQVQIDGFYNRDYSFTSADQTPYERSFSIQDGKAVLIGWPIRGRSLKTTAPTVLDLIRESKIYPSTLDDMRCAFQAFNILHKYHHSMTDVDNDLYFRIGLINPPYLSSSDKLSVEQAMRSYLSARDPLIIDVTLAVIYIASYDDETLPPHSTRVWPIGDAKVTSEFMITLYEDD